MDIVKFEQDLIESIKAAAEALESGCVKAIMNPEVRAEFGAHLRRFGRTLDNTSKPVPIEYYRTDDALCRLTTDPEVPLNFVLVTDDDGED